MKPFNLEEYLANPSRKVITRGGSPAMIICTNDEGDTPIAGFINMCGEEIQFKANKNGMYEYDGFIKQLFFDTDTKERWINICKNSFGNIIVEQQISSSKELSLKTSKLEE